MQRKWLGMLVTTAILASLAAAAVAIGPANLINLGGPTGGNAPLASSIGVPTWHMGDSWTYHVNVSSAVTTWNPFSVVGNLTRTVTATDGGQYNVSVHGSFHVDRLVDFATSGDIGNATIMLWSRTFMENATVDGFTLYRASDLAEQMDVRTVRITGSIWTEAGTFNASYTAKVATTYDPALDVWAFPINENETWNVSSNATIHAWIKWRLEAPNEYFEFGHNFTVTIPIRLLAKSGLIMDVTTPAGTFSAIPVRFALPTLDVGTTDGQLTPAMGIGADGWIDPRVPAVAWFSGDVGNVVKAVTVFGGARIVTELAAFHRS
jgi:hypothetical protein